MLSLVLNHLEKFMVPSVSYLGYWINQVVLQHKVKAVKETPSPWNVSELKSYLGVLRPHKANF